MLKLSKLSSVIARSTDIISDMALSLPDLLSPGHYQNYRNCCLEQIQKKEQAFVPNLLTHYCIQSLILQAHISYHSHILFRFGLDFLPPTYLADTSQCHTLTTLKPKEDPDLPPGLSVVRRWTNHKDQLLILNLVTLKPLRRMCANLLDYEILPIVKSYYLNLPEYRNVNAFNQTRILHNMLSDIIVPLLGSGIPVTISHFHFQNVNLYLETIGEQQTKNFLQSIVMIFNKNLKKGDIIIQRSPTSYLIVSSGATTRIMKERFKHIFFMIKSLVLEYKLDIYTVQKLPVDLNEIWKQLKL